MCVSVLEDCHPPRFPGEETHGAGAILDSLRPLLFLSGAAQFFQRQQLGLGAFSQSQCLPTLATQSPTPIAQNLLTFQTLVKAGRGPF